MAELLDLSAFEARAIALVASFGGVVQSEPSPSAGGGGSGTSASLGQGDSVRRAAAALERLGYVQIDTISVVERAHHHVLWSRDRDYRPSVLPTLEVEPRQAFEYWAHAAAYLPLSDFRYCLPRMRRIAAEGHEWFPSDHRVVEWVRDRVRAEGPLRSQDFQSEGARGPWWDWKPAKAALEYLFQSGELMVVTRPGFQKLYDLAERVLPPETDTSFPSDEEIGDWYVRRAAASLGVFTLRDIAYQRKDATAGIEAALERACEAGKLVPCIVREFIDGENDLSVGTGRTSRTGRIDKTVRSDRSARGGPGGKSGKNGRGPGTISWCASGMLSGSVGGGSSGSVTGNSGLGRSVLSGSRDEDDRPVRILSPFDNLIIDRKRASRIFGLEYTLECYVPAAKRKFGYFALPVFYQGRPVGLIDCKADRKNKVLRMNRTGFDWGTDPAGGPDGFTPAFRTELESFAAFNGCTVSEI